MTKEFWLNLPVKNLKQSKLFFTSLGFKFNGGPGDTPTSSPLLLGSKNIVVMLFEEAAFKSIVNQEVSDTQNSCEVLLSFDAESKEEVDEIAKRVISAGGKTEHKPTPMNGSMYGMIFSDLDGHKWNVLYMNFK